MLQKDSSLPNSTIRTQFSPHSFINGLHILTCSISNPSSFRENVLKPTSFILPGFNLQQNGKGYLSSSQRHYAHETCEFHSTLTILGEMRLRGIWPHHQHTKCVQIQLACVLLLVNTKQVRQMVKNPDCILLLHFFRYHGDHRIIELLNNCFHHDSFLSRVLHSFSSHIISTVTEIQCIPPHKIT